jgi:hypothetical protein
MKKTTLFLLTAAAAGQVLAVDVTTFDIGGVKLGMNPAEAKAALQVKCKRDQGKFDETTVLTPNPYLPGKKYANSMHCRTQVTDTAVGLVAIPSGAVVVQRVAYGMPWSVENENSLKESALAKYGEPTNVIQMNNAPEWCNDPRPSWKGGPACQDSPGPMLRVVRSDLILFDPRYMQQVWDDQKAKQTVRPSL